LICKIPDIYIWVLSELYQTRPYCLLHHLGLQNVPLSSISKIDVKKAAATGHRGEEMPTEDKKK